MDVDRRILMIGMSAAALTAPAMARSRLASQSWFDRAIVIDASSGLSDPYAENVPRLSDRAWRDLAASGITVACETILPVGNVADPWAEFQASIAKQQLLFSANRDRLLLVRSAADILQAKREGKLGIVMQTQDTAMVAGDLDRLARMKSDGIRIVQLTYNNANLSGDGAIEPRNGGITKLGKATIERIEGERLVLDLAHGGARTMAEAAAFAKRPLTISHTGARALADLPRNTSDETIRAVADKGGVVGIYFKPFLATGRKVSAADVLDHIDHVARVAGEEHIGIGTDNYILPVELTEERRRRIDDNRRERIRLGIAAPGEAIGVLPFVEELNVLGHFRLVADMLEKRGWSVPRLEKLFGGNFLRLYRDVWGG